MGNTCNGEDNSKEVTTFEESIIFCLFLLIDTTLVTMLVFTFYKLRIKNPLTNKRNYILIGINLTLMITVLLL